MDGLRASNFKQIHLGLVLELVLMFTVPVIMAILLAVIIGRLSASDVNLETVTVQMLLKEPTLAVRAFYSLLAFQYCAVALCALPVVSGLGKLEADVPQLNRSKRCFLALILTEAIAMLAHIISLLLSQNDSVPIANIASVAFAGSLLMLLILRTAALRRLMQGFAEILERIGSDDAAKHASLLSRRIVLSASLILAFLLGSVVLWLLDLSAVKRICFVGAAAAFIFYVTVRIRIAVCSRKTADVIASISE